MLKKRQRNTALRERQEAAKKRIAFYAEALGKSLDEYESNHTNWRGETLLWLIEFGLLSLRHYIESKADAHVTWDSPFVELHYPIDWNWSSWRKGRNTGISINTGVLTETNTRTKKHAVKTMAEIMVKQVTLVALQEFTHNVGYEKRRNGLLPLLSRDVGEFVQRLKGKRKQKQALERLFQPFSIGAGLIDFDENEVDDNGVVPESVTQQLAAVTPLIDLPALEWTGNVDGHQLRILLIFLIHPFVVDRQAKSAFFPITIGLQLVPANITNAVEVQKLMGEPWINPKNWSKNDRKAFWSQLVAGLREIAKGITPPQPREMTEAVVSVNAKIKVATKDGDSVATKSVLEKMLKTFSKTGQIIQWDCDTNPVVVRAENLCWANLSDEGFERLLFNLVSGARGYENPEWLTHTNAADKGRDISVYRAQTDTLGGVRRLRTIIQCKHKKGIGIAELVQLREQMTLWEPPRVDELIIATSGRFSSDAVQWIEKHNQSNHALRISMWPNSHLERILAERPHLIANFKLKQP